MKILFLGRHYTYFRNFESVLRELAAHGHAIHLAVERDDPVGGGRELVESLHQTFPAVTYGVAPSRADDDAAWTAVRLRLGLDYLRYQHPVFDQAYQLRLRARERTPEGFVALGAVARAGGAWTRIVLSRLLHRLERAAPEELAIRVYVEQQCPDVVLITPLIDLGSSQVEYLRVARDLRIPAALCVWSWDHLSSKALIRDVPDRVFVWNPTQRQEASDLHGIPAERVVVTGAQCFDQWFDRVPSRDRARFCREVGLPADRPFVLYVCSALFQGSPVEAGFVLDWVRQIRTSRFQALRDVGILVRPHPSRVAEWEGLDLGAPGAVVWGSNPVDARAKADYFDSLYHSAAVVGLNTSAFIEAGIVGRPVHTIILPAFESNQTGTVHFDYLLKAGGGLLNVARDMETHLAQLDEALVRPPSGVKPFVEAFVRPLGLSQAATPVFTAGVEQMPDLRVERRPTEPFAPFWRWCFRQLMRTRHVSWLERWTLSGRELASADRMRGYLEQKAGRRAAARREHQEKELRREQTRAARLEQAEQYRQAKAAEIRRRRAEKDARSGRAQASPR